MTYGEKRLLAGGIIFCILLFVPIVFLLALPLYGIFSGHATGFAIVASGVIEFFITLFVWSIPSAALAYWLSGVFVKRPVVR